MWVVVILDRVYFTVQTVHQIILMRLLFGQREDFIRYVILSYSNGFRWIFASRGTIYSGLIALCSVSSGMDGSTTLLIINSTTFLSLSLCLFCFFNKSLFVFLIAGKGNAEGVTGGRWKFLQRRQEKETGDVGRSDSWAIFFGG